MGKYEEVKVNDSVPSVSNSDTPPHTTLVKGYANNILVIDPATGPERLRMYQEALALNESYPVTGDSEVDESRMIARDKLKAVIDAYQQQG